MMQQMGQVETVDMLIPQDKVGLVIGEKTLPECPIIFTVN